MGETDRRARVAGWLYLLSLVEGLFCLMYIPGRFIVAGRLDETIARIQGAETLFRVGVAGELAGAVIWILVVRALYRLLAEVDGGQAWLMAALGLMCVPVMLVSAVFELVILRALADPGFTAAFGAPQREALVGLLLRAHSQGLTVAAVFWGLWLFPFAVLVWRSGFLPRALAAALVVGGLGYLVSCGVAVVAPAYNPVVGPVTSITMGVGELPVIFWLVLMGARPRARAHALAVAGE
jgi:Domain of unknown function (DUF4386)